MATSRHTQVTPQAGYPRRGEIWVTALDPTAGREIQKTRPALIVQNDISNRLSAVAIVTPITSPVRLPLNLGHVHHSVGKQHSMRAVEFALERIRLRAVAHRACSQHR